MSFEKSESPSITEAQDNASFRLISVRYNNHPYFCLRKIIEYIPVAAMSDARNLLCENDTYDLRVYLMENWYEKWKPKRGDEEAEKWHTVLKNSYDSPISFVCTENKLFIIALELMCNTCRSITAGKAAIM